MGENNRRLVNDRRNIEAGPPKGWRERRRSVERRYPEVHEISFSEWVSIMRTYHFRPQQLRA
jgi:hypothetical protein